MRKLFVLMGLCCLTFPALANPSKNVIFILADDLGWNDTSIYQQNQFYETPNIDALAKKGMVFSHAFSNSPLCSPTRASILTGQTPARHGILSPNTERSPEKLSASSQATGPWNRPSTTPLTATRLDSALPTLGKMLKLQGYHTAHFGKWHLGPAPYSALEHGFDIDIPHYSGSGPSGGYLAPWSFAPNLKPQSPGEHIDIRLAKEAKKWILDTVDDGPFFVNFWPFSVHAPFTAERAQIDHFIGKRSPYNAQRSATYAAMVNHFDDAVGILYSALTEAGIENDTIIIFTSDNGGNMYDVLGEIHPTSNFPLRGGKATQFDGGSRVPTFVIWPSVTQANTLNDIPVQSVDFYPTLLNGLGIEMPANHTIDGKDIRPLLLGESMEKRPVITYFPVTTRVPDWLPPSATVLYDGWKLIKTFYYGENATHLYQLYHVAEDVGESTNLAETAWDKRIELDTLLTEYLDLADAPLPLQNPDYRPGTFDASSTGKPADQFLLPEEQIASGFGLTLNTSHLFAYAGDSVLISWELINGSSTAKTSYKQFMGPAVTTTDTGNGITFTVPEVSTAQFISFAFVASDSDKTLRKQIGVRVLPVNLAPTIALEINAFTAHPGSTVNIHYAVNDSNKDNLTISAQSPALAIAESLDVTQTAYDVTIPSTYTGSEATITFTVSDGQASQSEVATITVEHSSINSNNGNSLAANQSSGGGSAFGLISILFIALSLRSSSLLHIRS